MKIFGVAKTASHPARRVMTAVLSTVMLGAVCATAEVLEPDPNLLEIVALFGDTEELTDTFTLAVPADASPTDYVLAVVFDDPSPTLRASDPEPWLTVADAAGEASGTIAAGDFMECTITVSPAGLAVGEYGATITCGDAWGDVRVILVIRDDMEMIVVAGDFTGDRGTDLLAVTLRGQAFIWPASQQYGVVNPAGLLGVTIGYPAAGDLDGDGQTDLLLLDENGTAYYWLSSEGYSQRNTAELETMGWPLLGDVDGDRRADLIIIDEEGDNITYWLSSEGYATAHNVPLGIAGQPVMGDVDGDGLADLLIIDDDGRLWALLSTLGYAQLPGNPLDMGFEGLAVAGDFNYDGLADLLDMTDDLVHTYMSPIWQRSAQGYPLPMPEAE